VRELVPRFLLDRLAEGADHGELSGAAVHVDLVGFTTLADSLARHGAHGAELLAGVVAGVLEPVIDAVYAQAGFVATFTGDGLMAVFDDPRRALAAAMAVSAAIERTAAHPTPDGSLRVQAKLGTGAGEVLWHVLRSADGRRATYAFSGSATEAAVAAEAAAGHGELILHP
jgi:class 3 adenylate cyclase